MSGYRCWYIFFFLFPRCVNRHSVPFSLHSSDYLWIQMRIIMWSIKLRTLNVHVPETFVFTSSVTKLLPVIGRYVLATLSIDWKQMYRANSNNIFQFTIINLWQWIHLICVCLFCWGRAHANPFNTFVVCVGGCGFDIYNLCFIGLFYRELKVHVYKSCAIDILYEAIHINILLNPANKCFFCGSKWNIEKNNILIN